MMMVILMRSQILLNLKQLIKDQCWQGEVVIMMIPQLIAQKEL
jgi:hypothetical protein